MKKKLFFLFSLIFIQHFLISFVEASFEYSVYEGGEEESFLINGYGRKVKALVSYKSPRDVDLKISFSRETPYLFQVKMTCLGAITSFMPKCLYSAQTSFSLESKKNLYIWTKTDPFSSLEKLVSAFEIEEGRTKFDPVKKKKAYVKVDDHCMISWQRKTLNGNVLLLYVWHESSFEEKYKIYKQTWQFQDINKDGKIDKILHTSFFSDKTSVTKEYFVGKDWVNHLRHKYKVLLPVKQDFLLEDQDMGIINWAHSHRAFSWETYVQLHLKNVVPVVNAFMKEEDLLLTSKWRQYEKFLSNLITEGASG
ncbi:hypothetical protein AB834_05040 [PVC group bacterium (ex Bugula neritina AB1)]|nr:hypothetical protein AB834_05040 [PVC group bacterium (ex Bugula neritina AB1)]